MKAWMRHLLIMLGLVLVAVAERLCSGIGGHPDQGSGTGRAPAQQSPIERAIQNLKLKIQNQESKIQNGKSKSQYRKSKIQNLKSQEFATAQLI
jgi:hypothetical protein